MGDESDFRFFVASKHMRSVTSGEWETMFDSTGRALADIAGRSGAVGATGDGTAIGVDLIRMLPGSSFDLHTHAGQHILFVLEGVGELIINGERYPIQPGDSVFIPAEYPHGVAASSESEHPLALLSFGYPHKHLAANDRMQLHAG